MKRRWWWNRAFSRSDGCAGRGELEAVFEEWLVRFDACMQQGGDYVASDDFDKHLFILWSIFHAAMLNFCGAHCQLSRTWFEMNAKFDVISLEPVLSLGILRTDHRRAIGHFSSSIFCLILSGNPARNPVHAESDWKQRKYQDSSPVARCSKSACYSFSNTVRRSLESDTLSFFRFHETISGKHVLFAILQCRERNLHKMNYRSASMMWVTSDRSFVKHPPDLGSSKRRTISLVRSFCASSSPLLVSIHWHKFGLCRLGAWALEESRTECVPSLLLSRQTDLQASTKLISDLLVQSKMEWE
jgi:hypothetical protein